MTQSNSSGAGPPKNVEPADLWTRLTTLPRPHTEVAFPRRDSATGQWMTDKVGLWVLTEAELMSCRAAADIYAKDLLDKNAPKSGDASLGYLDIYRNALVVEVVWRACRNPQALLGPAFPSTAMIRRYLTSDELAVLFQAYSTFQVESGPMLSSMTKDEMDAWIEALVEGGSAVPLARMPLGSVTELLMHSVSTLRKSRRGNGSAGSPDGELSSGIDPPSNSSSPAGSGSASLKPENSSPVDDAERPPPLERDT